MDEYKKLEKYLERFARATGTHYQLSLSPNPDAETNKIDEIDQYLKGKNND
tara:strand:+ start:2688 stop:2840 length:153 start_codon:yes stop_codon:yes gene_type:complete